MQIQRLEIQKHFWKKNGVKVFITNNFIMMYKSIKNTEFFSQFYFTAIEQNLQRKLNLGNCYLFFCQNDYSTNNMI